MTNLFVIATSYNQHKPFFMVYEPYTDSLALLHPHILELIMNLSNIHVIGVEINRTPDGHSDIKSIWDLPRFLNDSAMYTAVAYNKDDNKLLLINSTGWKIYKSMHEITHAGKGIIANNLLFDKYTHKTSIDITPNKLKQIETLKSYQKFIQKTNMLGYKYAYERLNFYNTEVIIQDYLGNSKDVVVPSFVTGINARTYIDIGTIQLNNGLKIIGEDAFRHSTIHNITLPSTVELVMEGNINNWNNNLNHECNATILLNNDSESFGSDLHIIRQVIINSNLYTV